MDTTLPEKDVFVWYDTHGRITAVGTAHPSAVNRITPIARAGQHAMHLKINEQHIARLHETHRIDMTRGTLVLR